MADKSRKNSNYNCSNGSGVSNVSALELHLMGMTKRTFHTRKDVLELIKKTENDAKEKAKKKVEQIIATNMLNE